MSGKEKTGLYIHVPFCSKRCSYCDFYSSTDVHVERIRAYVESVKQSLRAWAPQLKEGEISTIYFGGGTPAMLGRYIIEVLEEIHSCFVVDSDAEITVEANPGSLSGDIVEEWIGAGVGRISIGVQSFDKDALKVLGRFHTVEDTMKALALLDECEVTVSLDLMCGIPYQNSDSWKAQLEMAIACDPDHISIYPLTLEEGTVLAQKVEERAVPEPSEDEVARQMQLAHYMLSEAQPRPNQKANYAKPSKESRHNLGYWSGVPYLGIGPSAASMFREEDGTRIRGIVHSSLDCFLESAQQIDRAQWDEFEALNAEKAVREGIMLGMRLMRGVEESCVDQAGLSDVFEELVTKGLVEHGGNPNRFRPTSEGWLLGNEIYGAIWNQSR